MKEDPPPDAKCRDKFLVQSVLVTADKEFTNVASLVRQLSVYEALWANVKSVVTHRTDVQVLHPGEED
jgi:hypothetical protein